MKEYSGLYWSLSEVVRKPHISALDKVYCPKCHHFAAYRVNENGKIYMGEAYSYICAILKCAYKFSLEEAVPSAADVPQRSN